MKLLVKKNVNWENVYLISLCKGRREKKPIELKFNSDSILELEIDLNRNKYIYFTDGKENNTKLIILNKSIIGLNIIYNEVLNIYDVLFFNNFKNHYKVEVIELYDKINLPITPNNKKKIFVGLPYNYNSNNKYDLLIMLDGQNMFYKDYVGNYTNNNDPYNGWQLDVSLENIYNGNSNVIICGLETIGNERMFELTQSNNFGKLYKNNIPGFDQFVLNGHLEDTTNFIVDKVIPLLKEKYNISDYIGVGGSSAGGNASYYIGLKHNEIFKYVLSFSPVMGFFSNETLIDFYNKIEDKNSLPYLMFCTGKEGDLETIINVTNKRVIKLLVDTIGYPKEKIYQYFENKHTHNEILWRYGFSYFMDILNDIKQK